MRGRSRIYVIKRDGYSWLYSSSLSSLIVHHMTERNANNPDGVYVRHTFVNAPVFPKKVGGTHEMLNLSFEVNFGLKDMW